MHHIHISTGFMFVLTILILGIVGIIVGAIVSRRNSRDRTTVSSRQEAPQQTVGASECREGSGTPTPASWPMSNPVSGAPVYVHGGPGGMGLLTGVLLGEAIASGNHETVIHDSSSSNYSDSGSYSSPDSGFTSGDSGSSSYDSGSGGGFDASWYLFEDGKDQK